VSRNKRIRVGRRVIADLTELHVIANQLTSQIGAPSDDGEGLLYPLDQQCTEHIVRSCALYSARRRQGQLAPSPVRRPRRLFLVMNARSRDGCARGRYVCQPGWCFRPWWAAACLSPRAGRITSIVPMARGTSCPPSLAPIVCSDGTTIGQRGNGLVIGSVPTPMAEPAPAVAVTLPLH
jgi:hypothetical protein